jgi:hypothetical protein
MAKAEGPVPYVALSPVESRTLRRASLKFRPRKTGAQSASEKDRKPRANPGTQLSLGGGGGILVMMLWSALFASI